ncbi:COG4705 family protein [Clavibacter michiganensis]|uniref:COG4705 family protein n=1 Tax=Clavibacter michiganensis TaxID=28447 RepID=UPI003EBB471D
MTTPDLARTPRSTPAHRSPRRYAASTVPAATGLFWILKVLTTGMGETASDFLATSFDPVLVVGLAGLAFLAALALQFRVRRFIPAVYWLAVLMVSVFGTMVADVLHVVVGVPYALSTAAFALALSAVFVVWWRVEGTLSIHAITTPRRALFYWLAVSGTFALGTAAGDLTASTLGLGYLPPAVLIAVPAVAFRRGRMGAVAAFWAAYVITRPLGASICDWLADPVAARGLGLGTGPVTLVALAPFLVLVSVAAVRRRVPRAAAVAST